MNSVEQNLAKSLIKLRPPCAPSGSYVDSEMQPQPALTASARMLDLTWNFEKSNHVKYDEMKQLVEASPFAWREGPFGGADHLFAIERFSDRKQGDALRATKRARLSRLE